jgi:CubicO group peptidase (beta-lactamase class C family)
LLALALVLPPWVQAETREDAKTAISARVKESLRRAVPDWFAQKDIPGLAIALVANDTTLWHQEYGDLAREGDRPVTDETIFSIQSMSKSLTALAVLTAVQDGLVELDTPITAYLPKLTVHSRFEDRPAEIMTLRHLLSHRAGFTMEAPIGGNMEFDPRPHDFAEHVASISDTWLRYPVGYRYAYSNLGFDLAGYILQIVSGQPFPDYVRDHVLGPLGMLDSTFDPATIEAAANRAVGHEAGTPDIPAGIPVVTPMIPAGGMYSSARDMARYVRFVLNEGAVDGEPLLQDDLFRELFTVQFPMEHQRTGFGFGFIRQIVGSTFNVYHGGAGFGFTSGLIVYPELDFGIVMLTNSFGHGISHLRVRDTVDQAVTAVLGPTMPLPERQAVQALTPVDPRDERVRSVMGHYHRGLRIFARDDVLGITTNGSDFYPLSMYLDGEALVGRFGFFSEVRFLPPLPDHPGSLVKIDRRIDNAEYFDFLQPNAEDDVPGPNRARWSNLLGHYVFGQWGRFRGSLDISIRNGYLYADSYRCREYEPGLFFTYHGEVLDFRCEPYTYRNMVFFEQPTSP